MDWGDAAEAELWARYHAAADAASRDRLLLHYAPWAASVARSVHRKVWASPVDSDDFVQNARVGLIEAISRFDPGRGVPFVVYAKPRVRGAVFNGLRAIRGDRPPTEQLRQASRLASLQDEAGGDAFDSIVDAIVGLGLGYLLDDTAQRSAADEDVLAYAQASQRSVRLRAAVTKLPERLRGIIENHYFHHVAFSELAAAAGLTRGRISQLHKAALTELRGLLHDLE